MKIKQVEELVGITSKNIRFYEEQGLLQPDRAENGYREYHEREIDILKKIKLFRKLGVPVEDIHLMFENKLSLEGCMERRIAELKKEQKDLENIQVLAKSLYMKEKVLDQLDCDVWLEEMDNLEKEGIDFVDVSRTDIHMRKKLGAFAGGAFMILIMLLLIVLGVFGMCMERNISIGFRIAGILAIAFIPGAVIAALVVMISNRLKEIDSGEEDEAAKY